jgi:DNA-binding response OmpR family regulator
MAEFCTGIPAPVPCLARYRGFASCHTSFVPTQRGEKAVPLKWPSLDQPFYRNEHLFVDLRQQLVILDGQTLTLTRQEYRLLAVLVEYGGKVVSRAILLTQVFGYAPRTYTHVGSSHWPAAEETGARRGRRIETIFGKGYRFRLLHGSGNQGLPELDTLTNSP